MSLNQTPAGERVHIGIFGCRNAGKSSVINAVTGQNLAIVSEVKGTTTDPVRKAMELLPLGPVMIIDTPGLDDDGELGALRIDKAYQALNKTDIALLVVDSKRGFTPNDERILQRIKEKNIPYIVVMNKVDLLPSPPKEDGPNTIYVSAEKMVNIHCLKETIAAKAIEEKEDFPIISDLISPNSVVVLVVPVDSAAPKGRLILPQQQTIREILDSGATAMVVQDNALEDALKNLKNPPDLVVTDSQVFHRVAAVVPDSIGLTSFSILFARHKGRLKVLAEGAKAIDNLKDGDRVLISEGCTHHRQCEDIGTVKLPKWLKNHTGKNLDFHFTSGTEFPMDLRDYALVVHCGGCTLNRREMHHRIDFCTAGSVPVTNYGIAISYLQGILSRCLDVFKIAEEK